MAYELSLFHAPLKPSNLGGVIYALSLQFPDAQDGEAGVVNQSPLKVLPPALQAASGVIAGYAAEVALQPGPRAESAEICGAGAAALDGAFEGYCAAFSQRLSSASAALMAAAHSFTAMDDTNSAALASIAPVRTVAHG
jgi:hypothetical protein